MEITDIRVHTLALPAIESSKANSSQDACILEVETDDGTVGIGEADASPAVVKAVVNAPHSDKISGGLRNVVEGRDPFDVEVLWNEMYKKTYYFGRKGAALAAISAIDIALWDIIGKAVDRPLYQLLGGKHRDSVRAYASTLFPERPEDLEHMRSEAQQVVEDGFNAVKFGWGCFGDDREADQRLLATARETLGSDVDLMVDLGMAWEGETKRAIKGINELDAEHDLFWVEEPVLADNYEGYAKISDACSTRIVGGEEEYSVYGFKTFIENGDVDGVQPDVARSGGITHMEKIAALSQAHGLPVYPHGYSTDIIIAANLHLIAANENLPLLEYCIEDSPLRWDVVNEEFPVEDGRVSVPDRPGLGVTLNEDTIAKYQEDM